MKRKAEVLDALHDDKASKKRPNARQEGNRNFRDGLFDQLVLSAYQKSYSESKPYKHGVIQSLISDTLLRNVRTEIQENLSFTPKETDIYKIHQSGDLANLDGLDDSSLKLLPSLHTLRDALYSKDFRKYLSTITSAGSLSGKKTDMAINVYTPGCHLLCHDDVIGSRRVSYILYLTDPDRPWKAEWGGALRLYPIQAQLGRDGDQSSSPSPDFSVSIPPAFNQLSFFAVQPGESFHDVEEVYAKLDCSDDEDGGRVRTAISGWYHIPQEGEEGFEPGLEEQLTEKSSLMQLQSKGDQFDLPQPKVILYDTPLDTRPSTSGSGESSKVPIADDITLTDTDLDFLLKYIAPTYLTPDTLDSLSSLFASDSSLRVENILSPSFSTSLRTHIETSESITLPSTTPSLESSTPWTVTRPPHKHRFLYLSHPPNSPSPPTNPLTSLLHTLLPSLPFRKWLQLATGLSLTSYSLLARRFRRGKDYTLATNHTSEDSQLEITIGITPTLGWGDDPIPDTKTKTTESADAEDTKAGGYEVYMASDDLPSDNESDNGVPIPPDLSTGAHASATSEPRKKADPAVYQAATDEDDGVLFSMPAGWNRMSIVLRDKGVLRFVKYVSAQAKGDRWDVTGVFRVEDDDREEGESVKEDGEAEAEAETEKEDYDDDTNDNDTNDSSDESSD